MRATLVALVLFAGATVQAQTFQATPPVTLDLLSGWTLVGPITLTPDTPGDELLYRFGPWGNVVIVAVPHPTKSGPFGLWPGPGVCLEAFQHFDDTAMHDGRITIADVNRDGIDDIIGTAGAVTQVLFGIGLSACR